MYILLALALFALRFLVGPSGSRNRSAYFVVLVFLFLFSAFRFRVGCDWSGYYGNYLIGATNSYEEAVAYREPLWWLLQTAVHQWELPYPIVNVLTSAVFFIGIHVLARRQPDRLGFLVLLFPILIVNVPMSAIRQAAAIGFLCLSFVEFTERRPVRYVIWILIASTIHSSAAAFLALFPFASARFTRGRIAASVLMAIPGLYLFTQSDAVQVAVTRYVDTDVDALGAVFRSAMLFISGILYFSILQKPWKEQFEKDYGLVTTLSVGMLITLPLVAYSTVVADRFGYYLVPIQAMIFARIPFLTKLKVKGALNLVPYLVLMIVFVYWNIYSAHFELCYNPYDSWLFGNEGFGVDGF